MAFKDYLNLTAWDVRKMSEGELREAITTLNDVANKRIKRLEASGLAEFSPAYTGLRESTGNTRFRLSRKKLDKDELKTQYIKVRTFLDPQVTKTGTIGGTKESMKSIKPLLEKVLNDGLENKENLDKRYKTPTLKKSAKKQLLSDFWDDYEIWKEIEKDRNPNKFAGDSPIKLVDEFYEDYYEQGKTSIEEYEKGAKEDYEQAQRRLQQEWDGLLSSGDDDGGRVDAPKSNKHKGKGKGIESGDIKVKFEKVKIF